VLQNLLVGRHCHRHTSWWQDLLFTPKVRQTELQFRRTVEEVIEFLELQHYRDSMVAGLPYGVRKVVELGRALSMRPKLLLLDEPSSGLNVDETEDMGFWIEDIKHDLGVTVIMVEHDMGLVSRVSDRVLALNQGEELALGTAAEVQAHPAVVEAYLGGVEDDDLPPSPLPREGGAQAHPDGGNTALPPSPSPREGVTSHPAPSGSGAGGEGATVPAASSGRPGAGGKP
jgi:branched-chain amino acid transport system ATP-binding protein